MIPPSTPIEEVTQALNLTVSLPSHVRVAADLLEALKRGEVELTAAQTKRVKDAIG